VSIRDSNKISSLVQYGIPQFVRMDHPTFVSFINLYFEWLEQQGIYLRSPMELQKVKDIDVTFDEFVSYFKKEYLLNFPEKLAINQKTGEPVDTRKLIKHIKQFYKAKGTEKTYELLFRILYDTNVEFYYPKLDILRVSDGKWILKKAIRVTSTLGSGIFEALGKTIYQVNSSGNIIATGVVSNISRYQLGVFETTEIELESINGTFLANYGIQFTNNSDTLSVERKVYSVISSISISNGGTKYRIGDKVIFTNAANDVGQKADAEVSQVNSSGKIIKIKINNFGINYNTAPTITIQSEKGSGFSGTVTVGGLCNFDGYYQNNDGKLSSNKVLQDNHYYQDFSYVLKTEMVINKYRNILKKLIHPAGLAFFGQVLIKRQIQSELFDFTKLTRYEVPIIGHYLPYTPKTHDDLSKWFSIDGTHGGYYPDLHNPLIITAGNCNPVSAGVDYIPGNTGNWLKEDGFTRADPFWIIYEHPNKRIGNNGPVISRISSEVKDEFYGVAPGLSGWEEWTMEGTAERGDWYTNFTGDYKYAILQYNQTSDFRKITIGSFLNMPLGDDFDSRADPYGIINSYDSPNF